MINACIKKTLYFLCGVLCIAHNMFAITVGPVLPGERLWTVTSRIGQATNVIESKVCELEFDVTVTFNFPDCDVLIEQIDIPYVISASGYYCVNENLEFTGGLDAITISSSDVILDLKGHTIDGMSGSGDNAIVLSAGMQNITIKDGALKGADDFGIVGVSDNQRINIRNIAFIDSSESLFFDSTTRRFVIEDCHFVGGSVAFEGVTDGVIRNCTFQQIASTALRFERANRCNIIHCVFDDIANGLLLDGGCNHIFVRNCVARNATSRGFTCENDNSQSIVFDQCIAQQSVIDGFQFNITGTAPMESILLRDCCAQNCGRDGFLLNSAATGSIRHVVFDRCVAMQNTRDGFRCDSAGSARIDNVVMRNCQAVDNEASGFNINTLGTVSCIGCVAQANDFDGIDIDAAATDCKVVDCCAVSNGAIGINNAAGDSNAILGNAAFNNATNIVGISDGTFIVSRALVGALAGSSRWTNAVS